MVRTWSNKEDGGAVHVMGNGEILACGRGPELVNLYGPPYTSPNVLTMTVDYDGLLTNSAVREPGTAIWDHEIEADGEKAMEFVEFTASNLPAYVRMVDCVRDGVSFVLRPHPSASFLPSACIENSWQQVIRPGQYAWHYPTCLWSFHWVILGGSCTGELRDDGSLIVRCGRGKGFIIVAGGNEYPDTCETAEKIKAEELLIKTRNYWKEFTERRLSTRPVLKSFEPKIAEILDGAAVLIKAQQSKEGGVGAGHYYPLAYVRDQYGTARGMLALGMYEEAKANIEFRAAKFARFGNLFTAEAMGTDCIRHRHEFDEVEGPAYTILQVRDYVRATGGDAFAEGFMPMLEWCWDIQKKQLAGGMLSFNGDETYVAGGFYPRSGLLHGSADTTLVFAESGRWLAEWASSRGIWTKERAAAEMAFVNEAASAYREHFFDKDRVWANEPSRMEMIKPPAFRHGVCEARCGWFGWTQLTEKSRYVCPLCFGVKELPEERPERMEVYSVSLLPIYIGSEILTDDEIRVVAERVLKSAHDNGHIPSIPGTSRCVGYDAGLLLMNLASVGHPSAKEAYERVLRMLDSAGAWTEYYEADDMPSRKNCMCRPWETGINACALVDYLERKANVQS